MDREKLKKKFLKGFMSGLGYATAVYTFKTINRYLEDDDGLSED